MENLPSHHYDGAVLIAPKAQDAYFHRYRIAHPEESFDVLDLGRLERMFQYELSQGADDLLLALGVNPVDLELTKTVVKRLRYAPRIQGLVPYFSLRDELEKSRFLRIIHDPFTYFKGKMIIVRGYSDGRAISEAMQDLPNICVNFDFGQERPRLEPAGQVPAGDLLISEDAEKPIYLLAPEKAAVPERLQGLTRLAEPYAPSVGSFFVLSSSDPYFEPMRYPLPDEILKALRLPTACEAQRRLDVEMRHLLLSPRLLAYIS